MKVNSFKVFLQSTLERGGIRESQGCSRAQKMCRMTCSDSTCCGPPQRWTASPVVILHSLEEAAARGTALVNVDMVNLV